MVLAKTWFGIFLSAMAAADIHAEVNYENFEAAPVPLYRQLLELAVFITGCLHVCVEPNGCQRKKASKENSCKDGGGIIHVPQADGLGFFAVIPTSLSLIAPDDRFLSTSGVPVDVGKETGFVTREAGFMTRSLPATFEEFTAGSLAAGGVCFATELDLAGGADLVAGSSWSMFSITSSKSFSIPWLIGTNGNTSSSLSCMHTGYT